MQPLAGAIGGLIFGVIAGHFATKRTGTYFAMITLAIAELVHSLAPHLKGIFGGEAGMSTTRMPAWGISFGTTNEVYYLTLAWVVSCLALLYLFTRTPLGRLTLGLRENSHRLRFLGYDVHRLSMLVFAISAMFSGIAGGLQVLSNEAANYIVFDPGLSSAVVLNAYIGGVKSFLGPALGAALMTFFGYALSDASQSWLLYQGILFVLVMMFAPSGLAGLAASLMQLHRRFGTAAFLALVCMYVAAGLCLSAGGAFVVEMLQRLFSQEYRALAVASAGGHLPALVFLGRTWLPGSITTWLPPLLAIAVGCLLVWLARRRTSALTLREEAGSKTQADSLAPHRRTA
jgi:branched-chain amino acid transport system permease protein